MILRGNSFFKPCTVLGIYDIFIFSPENTTNGGDIIFDLSIEQKVQLEFEDKLKYFETHQLI